MNTIDKQREEKLIQFATALVNQEDAKIIVPAQQPEQGYWFGGGNMVEDADGDLHVVGRYRNGGDSRTGLKAGERGCELALFSSKDHGNSFEKTIHFKKADLNVDGKEVLSIEGSAIQLTDDGVELFVSTEKDLVGYPAGFENHLKPGTGVWSIEKISASSFDALPESEIQTILSTDDPQFLHIKDPFLYRNSNTDYLMFCHHPFSWSSSNTGYAIRQKKSEYQTPVYEFFPRGFTWDVAITRGTCIIDVPKIGCFSDLNVSLVFYDGGECLRDHVEHQEAISRSRGYSCEELGGAGYLIDGKMSEIQRLSVTQPLLVSPYGTGCSRYVDVLKTSDGFYASWQQSQADGSQPLVMNFLSQSKVQEILN